jgi:predicted DNA-binding ribbon-helix-helix protein
MLDLWKAFLNLCRLYDKIYEDPWNTMKSLEAEKETAPEECKQFYDALITLCRLKIIADKRNMTVIELVDEIVKDYVSRHGVM